MDWLKKAPTAVVVTTIIVCGVLALGVLGVFLALTINGSDTAEFRMWINTVGQLLLFPAIGVTAVAATSAARSAGKAEDQTNGQLGDRDDTIAALGAQLRAQALEIQALRQQQLPPELQR